MILIATFLFGFLCGVVLFLKSHTGQEGGGEVIPVDTKGFTILAHMYGGCSRGNGCASYQLTDTGMYTYIDRDRDLPDQRTEDVLSKKQIDELRTNVSQTNFSALKETRFSGTCPITYDDVAYRYDITYKGVLYTFDTCTEELEGVVLFDALEAYFEMFNIIQGT